MKLLTDSVSLVSPHKHTESIDKWDEMLEELSQYPDNWDGDDAREVKKETITNCRDILQKTLVYKGFLNDIYPTEFGTICIQWHRVSDDRLVNVEVAPNRIAFYGDIPGKVHISQPTILFSDDSVRKLISVLKGFDILPS